jgi:hypothetical protein
MFSLTLEGRRPTHHARNNTPAHRTPKSFIGNVYKKVGVGGAATPGCALKSQALAWILAGKQSANGVQVLGGAHRNP